MEPALHELEHLPRGFIEHASAESCGGRCANSKRVARRGHGHAESQADLDRNRARHRTLAAAALVDLIVYGRLKDITVCYRCHSEFRGAIGPTAAAFDLHIADELEQEYERKIGRR